MFPIQQQLASAVRAQFEIQLALYENFSKTAIESVEKLTELNTAAARASLQESQENAREMLQSPSPQEVLVKLRAQSGPALGKAIAYSNHLVHIGTSAQAEIASATETQIAQACRRATELIDEMAQAVPGGPGPGVALVKAAIGSASSGYGQVNRSARRAVQALETNVDAAVNQIVKPDTPIAPETTPGSA